jgi:hypothetical protein
MVREVVWTDLCSGIGAGFPYAGCKYAELNLIATCDTDEYAQDILLKRYPRAICIKDVRLWASVSQSLPAVELVTASPPCFAAGTLILTKQGYRPIESISIGDEVLTHKGRWRKVISTSFRNNVPLRTIKAGGVPGLVTTDEHPFYVRWQSSQRRKRLDGVWQYYRVFSFPVWVNAEDLTKNSRLGQVLPKERQSDRSPDFWWIVGRYLADGWRSPRKFGAGSGHRIRICCSHDEADYLEERIKRCFHTYRINERTVVKFEINGNELCNFLEKFGSGAGGKTIPGELLSLDKESARSLLEGWSSGDGYIEQVGNDSWCIKVTTISKFLALGMALLAQRAYGVVASVRECKVSERKAIEEREVNQQNFWIVSIPKNNRSAFVEGNYGWKQVRSNKRSGFGIVYNIGVAEDESYIADGAIVHNCQPFSIQGKRLGIEDKRDCFPAVIGAIAHSTPRFFCIENVPGLLSCPIRPGAGAGTYFTFILSAMAVIGYDVEWLCVESGHFAAPWRRKRLLMVGFPRGIIPHQSRPWIEQVREQLSCERDSWEGRGLQPGLAGVEERTASGVLVPVGVKNGDRVIRRRREALGNALDPRVAEIALRRVLYLNRLTQSPRTK